MLVLFTYPETILHRPCYQLLSLQDFSVDKDRLQKLGYTTVLQCSVQSKRADVTNSQIMDYLKGVVPKMFQVVKVQKFNVEYVQ